MLANQRTQILLELKLLPLLAEVLPVEAVLLVLEAMLHRFGLLAIDEDLVADYLWIDIFVDKAALQGPVVECLELVVTLSQGEVGLVVLLFGMSFPVVVEVLQFVRFFYPFATDLDLAVFGVVVGELADLELTFLDETTICI